MKKQSFPFRRGIRSFTKLMAFLSSRPVDEEFMVTIGPLEKERSPQQNKALWGCAYEYLRKSTGNDKEDLHEYFCGEFWGWDVNEIMGKKKHHPKRSTTHGYDGKRDVITTEELWNFYAFIQQRAAENGFYVPDPDPLWFLHQEKKAA